MLRDKVSSAIFARMKKLVQFLFFFLENLVVSVANVSFDSYYCISIFTVTIIALISNSGGRTVADCPVCKRRVEV